MPDCDRSVAVVLPARNASSTLVDALESIRLQSLKNFQCILVDHDSVDDTHRIMRDCSLRDPRFEVHQCRGSFVEAANLAWRKSTASFIARMDADDIAYPDRLARQLDFLIEHPDLSACATGVRIVKRGGNPSSPLPPDEGYARYEAWVNSVVTPEQIAAERFVDSPLPNPTGMIRRSVLENLNGYADPEWAEDYDFWLRLLESGEKAGKVDEILLDWYDGEERSTRTVDRYSLDQFQNAKACYFSRLELVRERGVVICGAGPIGKQFARLLEARRIRVKAFCEVNPRQIGNRLRSIPIRNSLDLGEFCGDAVAVAAVGLPGARQEIRELAHQSGFREGLDFFCVA